MRTDPDCFSTADHRFMRLALRLAKHGYGQTAPNPMVGAIAVRAGKIIGRGWHHQAGAPHAEIEAIRDAASHKKSTAGATLYLTLEPCSTWGRTPPCTGAIVEARFSRVVVATADPNPAHAGRGFALLRRKGVKVSVGLLEAESERLNEAFNHWIVHRSPFVTVKAAMTLDGKIATVKGESRWITGEKARTCAMHLRKRADAVLVGVNTILADDPQLTIRPRPSPTTGKRLRRVILDSKARTPLGARVVKNQFADLTTIIATKQAPAARVQALSKKVQVWIAPKRQGQIDLHWVLQRLGSEEVTSLLVEGGGEVNASFLMQGLAQRVVFFYAPKIVGGRDAPKAVAGDGVSTVDQALRLDEIQWRWFGQDLMLSARLAPTMKS
jgi:diaminohydroxyphosphoribosylaminopyrimidine deaminase / 5-amino-6-(5-phosphoribosylamino)uracil reductase